MDRQIRVLDPQHQATERTALRPSDPVGEFGDRGEGACRPAEPQAAPLESGAFTVIAGVLMSGALVAAVSTFIKAIASALS